jgi:hypothetical protein
MVLNYLILLVLVLGAQIIGAQGQDTYKNPLITGLNFKFWLIIIGIVLKLHN